EMGRWGDGEMGRWGDGEMGRWGDGEMGRWGEREMGRWGERERGESEKHCCEQGARRSHYIYNFSLLTPNSPPLTFNL
ncbi:MAG: hypothetical protein WBA39_10765, partial [Rivularia sp. (in: cyanobacteria)]